MNAPLNIVILAAGMGQRMYSHRPKVLHALAGQALLAHVLDTARALQPDKLIVVVGYEQAQIRARFTEDDIHFVTQAEQLGTGHAAMQAVPLLDDRWPTLILYGDVPLIQIDTLKRLIHTTSAITLGVLTTCLDDPSGYGRIVRREGNITHIVEQKDASPTEQAIVEINTGIFIFPTAHLKRWLATLSNHNAQGEYYLTDLVACAATEKITINSQNPSHSWEILGVNNKTQLAQLERILQRTRAQQLLTQGVTLADPERIDVRGSVHCGRDVTIDVGCIFEGKVTLADGVHIGPYCVLRDSEIAQDTQIFAYSHLDSVTVGADARIGPYARLRPGTVLAHHTHVGNFVEIKNSQLDAQTKANHLAYIGDATIGKNVNIGAGTITCNYDGANKHRTIIEDDVFIGSDTQLIAPLTVEKGATVGAGTTLTKSVPAHSLTVSRTKQTTRTDWQRPSKKNKS
ncbi:MAG: bifunctional UDP-N-acetylglucosamine diphosphorylase/glucosamine-1-phosphate N-acetyltransferase GlmU [Ottowia sp.]|nr:bifunctional UDP-N-acetylglucosamine diphosphorylase/glucosamine-1-phosphate N-acetyltransferase GlmU [Ottowia sp.]